MIKDSILASCTTSLFRIHDKSLYLGRIHQIRGIQIPHFDNHELDECLLSFHILFYSDCYIFIFSIRIR